MNDLVKSIDYPKKDFYKLENMRMTSEFLRHPELGRKTALVAGTNGKGSVVSFLTHMLLSTGVTVGTYTSPHIVHETERIRINGKPISRSELDSYEEKYKQALSPLTYFEKMTMLAFLVFRDRKVDWQVLEVGMGGRLDATNISEPDISLITSVSLDHQAVLGNTLGQIAHEKAGIFRDKKPALWTSLTPEAEKEVQRCAANLEVDQSFQNISLFLFEEELEEVERKWGTAQRKNMELALKAFLQIQRSQEVNFSLSGIIANALPLGRQQVYRLNPPFIIDGGHNEEAVESLVHFLDSRYPAQKFHIIFGLMEDKEVAPIVRLMKEKMDSVSLPIFFPPRQRAPLELAEEFRKMGLKEIYLDETVQKSVSRFEETNKPVLVFGSFYLAGDVLKSLEEKRLGEV